MASTADERRPVDWRGWAAMAWAVWFGGLYARMVAVERAPAVARSIERMVNSIRTMCR